MDCQDKKNIDIIIILDESFSMINMGREPIQAVDEFIKDQSEKCPEGNVTIVTFSDFSRTIIENTPFKDFTGFTDYKPDGLTALNDAICSTIEKKLKTPNKFNVVLIIITDGDENASQNYDSVCLKEMIKNVETIYKWKTIFIGANQDSFEVGSKMNVEHNRCANFDASIPGNLITICRKTSDAVGIYRNLTYNGQESDIKINNFDLLRSKSENISFKIKPRNEKKNIGFPNMVQIKRSFSYAENI